MNVENGSEVKMRRIYLNDEKKLMKVVNYMITLEQGDDAGTAAKKKKLQDKLQEFYGRYPRGKAAQRVYKFPKRLCHENIGDFIKTVGLSYKDLLEITNGTDDQRACIDWPKKIEKNMCALCDNLSKGERTKVYDLVREIVPQELLNIMESDRILAVKIFDAAAARTVEIGSIGGQVADDIMLRCVYTYCRDESKSFDVLPFYLYDKTSKITDESFHFMLGLDENDCVLAKNGQTEMIMDLFCMLPDVWKEYIYNGVRKMASDRKRKVH